MSILINVLLAIWMIVALLMILVILMQRPKSEGLGAAFGGGVTENIFGAQTTNVLVKFTGYLAAVFFIITFVLSILYSHRASGDSALRQELMKTQAGVPAASVTPGTTPAVTFSAAPSAAAASASPSNSLPPANVAASVIPAVSASVAPSAAPAASAPAQSPASPNP